MKPKAILYTFTDTLGTGSVKCRVDYRTLQPKLLSYVHFDVVVIKKESKHSSTFVYIC